MNGLIDYTLLCLGSLFVIVDPITLIPTFLSMTRENSVQDRVRMARVASFVTFVILTVFAWGGQFIFKAFGITLPAFQIAGGIILMIVALDMLQAKLTAVRETPEEQQAGISKDDIAITPLAIPLLAGPGAITAAILLSSRAETLEFQFVLLASILIVSVVTFFILNFAARKAGSLNIIAMRVMTRLMGLLLAVISVQFIMNGVRVAFNIY